MGAESLWSNALVERHNLALPYKLEKVLKDTISNIDIALASCIDATNSLTNIHGF